MKLEVVVNMPKVVNQCADIKARQDIVKYRYAFNILRR